MRNGAERHRGVTDAAPSERSAELRSFLFLTIVMIPVLSVVIVGVYGFLVWIFQIFAGPPSG